MSKNIKTVQPAGILDNVKANLLRREIIELVKDGAEIILVDCEQVSFMNSSGIGALVATLKAVRVENADLFLCSLSEQVKLIFELTKMNRIFKIVDNKAEFEQQIAKVS
jgi:anti-anti-sigma factor